MYQNDQIWTMRFWKGTAERVIASIAGGMLSVLGVDVIPGVIDTDWRGIVSIGLGAGVVSLLKSIAANSTTGSGPGFTNAEVIRGSGPDH